MAIRVVNFGSAKGGLATIGYTLYGTNGVAIGSRITAGVNEIGITTGIYAADVAMPDYDCVVLWDTGETPARYATEDYQNMVNSIANDTGQIQKIYNSIRNQGEFFATLMDRLGLLEKNEGLTKVSQKVDKLAERDNVSLTNMEEAFKKAAKTITLTVNAPEVRIPEAKAPIVNIPPFPEVKLPPINIPDYTGIIGEIKSMIAEVKGELTKVPKTQKEYSGNFDAISKMLSSFEKNLSKTVTDKTSAIQGSVGALREIFSRFDSLLGKINEVQAKLLSLDSNDKDIIQSRKEIADEVKRLNAYVNQMTLSMLSKDSREMNELVMSLGHKR